MTATENLARLGLTLPSVPAPVAAYVNCVRTGNLLFLSGGLPIDGEKKVIGQVPRDVSIEEAQEGARIIILNRLAVIASEIGSIDRVTRIVALNGLRSSEGHQRRIGTIDRNFRRKRQALTHCFGRGSSSSQRRRRDQLDRGS
jgi:enamine deaminase RidA (YjgF/YER057c/UK114 family)